MPGGGTLAALAGVGSYVLSRIPKSDAIGREIGFYNIDDVPHETRIGQPPKDAESRERWHPRNAPYGAAARQGSEHLSSVREDYLKLLAGKTGLVYIHLESAAELVRVGENGNAARLHDRCNCVHFCEAARPRM